MKDCEAQIVRRRLDDYASYKALAQVEEAEARSKQAAIDAEARPKSPSFGEHIGGSRLDQAQRLTRKISDQQDHEDRAKEAKRRMTNIRLFLRNNLDGEVLQMFEDHYIAGTPYEDMELDYNMSASGIRSRIHRAIREIDFERAAGIV